MRKFFSNIRWPWLILGVVAVPIELYVSAIWISTSTFSFINPDLENLTYLSNLCFYAGFIHMIFSSFVASPTLLTWYDRIGSKKHQDHFERLGRDFKSQFSAQTQYGYDEEKSKRNKGQGISFFIPGAILITFSVFIGT